MRGNEIDLPQATLIRLVKLDDHVVEGIKTVPEALRMLFDGRNRGKLVVRIK